jgi:hypothetical protein
MVQLGRKWMAEALSLSLCFDAKRSSFRAIRSQSLNVHEVMLLLVLVLLIVEQFERRDYNESCSS